MTKPFKHHIVTRIRILAILFILLLLLSLSASQSFAAPSFLAKNILATDTILSNKYTSQNYFGGTTYSTIAFDFHIFAEDVILTAHTNGNIATNHLQANNQGFGADEKNHLNKREDNYIGSYASGITNIASNGYIILGNSIPINVNQQDKRIKIGNSPWDLDQNTSQKIYQETTDSTEYINVSKELIYLAGLSKNLSQKKTSQDVIVSSSVNNFRKIEVTNQGGNHYLNLDAASFFNELGKQTLDISLPEKTTLIINVDMYHADINVLSNLVVNLNNYTNGEAIASAYCGLLWNLYDSGNCNSQFVSEYYVPVGTSDYFFGTILAPRANITYGALNGSVIAKQVKQSGKESHRFDFTGYEDPHNEPINETSTEIPSTEDTSEISTEITSTEDTSEISTEIISTEDTSEVSTEMTSTEDTSEISTEMTFTENTSEIISTEDTSEVSTEMTTERATENTTIITSEPTTETNIETIGYRKTGDDTKLFLLVIIFTGALGLFLTVLICKYIKNNR